MLVARIASRGLNLSPAARCKAEVRRRRYGPSILLALLSLGLAVTGCGDTAMETGEAESRIPAVTAVHPDTIPVNLRSTHPLPGIDWSSTQRIKLNTTADKLWVSRWKRSGKCFHPMPPGAKSVGYYCFSAEQIESSKAVQLLEQANGTIMIAGLAPEDSTQAELSVGDEKVIKTPVVKGVWVAIDDQLPRSFLVRSRSGLASKPVDLSSAGGQF